MVVLLPLRYVYCSLPGGGRAGGSSLVAACIMLKSKLAYGCHNTFGAPPLLAGGRAISTSTGTSGCPVAIWDQCSRAPPASRPPSANPLEQSSSRLVGGCPQPPLARSAHGLALRPLRARRVGGCRFPTSRHCVLYDLELRPLRALGSDLRGRHGAAPCWRHAAARSDSSAGALGWT